MKRKRIEESWETSVEQDSAGGNLRLYTPYEGKVWLTAQFKAGDRVRVTVTKLPAKRKKRK